MTREEIVEALVSVGQHHTCAQRELLQLTLRLQREGLTGDQAYGTTVAQAHEPGQAAVQESVARTLPGTVNGVGPSPATGVPTKAEALATAKEVLKGKLISNGQRDLLHLVDQVKQSDLDETSVSPALPTPAAQASTPIRQRTNVEFFRDWFDAQTMEGGRGPIGNGVFGRKRYEQDVRLARQADLRGWPSGFYTDHVTKAVQFMINQPASGRAILFEGLSTGDVRVGAHAYDGSEYARFAPVDLNDEIRTFLARFLHETVGLM
jgi:hypothetical protein